VYAQVWEARKRPKIAAAFSEPNSITLPGNAYHYWVAMPLATSAAKWTLAPQRGYGAKRFAE